MARVFPDDTLAAWVIWQEARGEPQEGRIAVAEVIRNRTDRKVMSNGTLANTLGRPWQFSGMRNTDPSFVPSLLMDDDDPIVKACYAAWETAKAGSNLANGADHYANLSIVQPPWAKGQPVAVVGRHTFFRLNAKS